VYIVRCLDSCRSSAKLLIQNGLKRTADPLQAPVVAMAGKSLVSLCGAEEPKLDANNGNYYHHDEGRTDF
jgi:hypothetical protein